MQQLTPELAKSFNLKDAKGALIAQIEKDGPADKAGLRDGDIVIEYNGKPISENCLRPLLRQSREPRSK